MGGQQRGVAGDSGKLLAYEDAFQFSGYLVKMMDIYFRDYTCHQHKLLKALLLQYCNSLSKPVNEVVPVLKLIPSLRTF